MTTTLNRIERACIDLAKDGQPITFAAVAEHSGIARSTLYRNQGFRAIVEHHRRTAPDTTITAITEEIATLRATVQELADVVRRHDTQLRRITRTER